MTREKPYIFVFVLIPLGKFLQKFGLVKEAQKLLVSVGIDPIKGKEVLCWAPNGVKGQHTYKTLKKTVNDIKEAINNGKGVEEQYDLVVEALERNKREAQNRTKNKTGCSKK